MRQKIRHTLILLSFFLFPATFFYFSPVLILKASSEGIINGSFLLFGLLFLSALFFGRGFCGWVCPAAGVQEALFVTQQKRITRGWWIKWLIWIPWIALIAAFAIGAGGYHAIDLLYQTVYGFSVATLPALISYLAVLLILIVIPSLLVGKRSFCHHLCWMAPFMILGKN